MNRSALKVAIVALLAATAIVAVAGSVDDSQTSGSGASVAGPADATETETTQPTQTGGTNETETRRSGSGQNERCQNDFQNPLLVLGVLGVLAIVVYATYRRYGKMEAIALAMVLLVLLFLGVSLTAVCGQTPDDARNRSGEPPDDPNITQTSVPTSGGSGGSEGPTTPDLPLALVAVVAVLAAAAVGGVLVTQDDDEDENPFEALEDDAEEAPDEAVDVDEFAAAAGRAADRIEDTDDVDNEIYRAWIEMTEHLDVEHPETSTPGEFAVAAVDAGIDRDDVVELTDLFERVRYGHTAATEEREDRALDALRRIEAQYGGEDA